MSATPIGAPTNPTRRKKKSAAGSSVQQGSSTKTIVLACTAACNLAALAALLNAAAHITQGLGNGRHLHHTSLAVLLGAMPCLVLLHRCCNPADRVRQAAGWRPGIAHTEPARLSSMAGGTCKSASPNTRGMWLAWLQWPASRRLHVSSS